MEVVLHEAAINVGVNKSESVVQYSRIENGTQTDFKDSAKDDERSGISGGNLQMLVDLSFQDVRYHAPLGFRKGTKEILHSISGRFPPGQLIAIMGPSGAGKSTLLDILSGYKKTGIQGTVYVNGEMRELKSFRKMSAYITQDDRLQPLLTVQENMQIAADLKLPTEVTPREKRKKIHEILVTLGLEKPETRKTPASRLSGGQKKRLSIALELISNPLILFLDEPTTGLDSSSCSQCIKLLKQLAKQGRTIICTIHQPSASLFGYFDEVYVLSKGYCVYQGSTENMIPFFEDIKSPCPKYHNPADYVIELACDEYGSQIPKTMTKSMQNGKSLRYFKKPENLPNLMALKDKAALIFPDDDEDGLQATSSYNQLKVLLRRGIIKARRDQTLTYMRLFVQVIVGMMLGAVYWQAGKDGAKVLDNYNLVFSILMHHMMSTMMLTILTLPNEMSILIKEHFNRWYSLKMYYLSITLVEIPLSTVCCTICTIIVYYMSAQPLELVRFSMFWFICLLVVFVAQSFGIMIGSYFDVVNGTFIGPALTVPIMMFAGFGVTIKDLPSYLYWGSYVSYLRYGLEGAVGAIYGMNRETLECPEDTYCHYAYPRTLLEAIDIRGDQFGNDVIALIFTLFFLRCLSYVLLRHKLNAVR